MPIRLDSLYRASGRPGLEVAVSKAQATARNLRTAFLCHSHADAGYAAGLVELLAKEGWVVYVDWMDATMPDTPDRGTAAQIQTRIRDADFFLFLATPHSLVSRWCPWELGYADGKKPVDSILVIPTRTADGTHHGNEYLQLYRHIDLSDAGRLGVWRPGQTTGTLLRSL